MAFAEKHLGQARENSTNAVSVYSPPANTTGIIKTINIAEVAGGAATFRLFIDNDGTTYDQSTAIAYDVAIGANEMIQLDGYWVIDNASGNIAYRSSVANALTITISGAEVS